jgi:ankyrin repeat protein
MDSNTAEINLQANKINGTESKLRANKIDGTEDLTDTHVRRYVECGVIGLMESARDGKLGDFVAKWQHFNLNRGVAFKSTDVKFRDQKMELEMLYAKQILALAKLYADDERARNEELARNEQRARKERARALAEPHEDEELARALAKLYEDKERARALAKLYEDAKQARAHAKQAGELKDFMTNVNEDAKKAKNWIHQEVVKIVNDVEGGGWRTKKTQSTNGDQKREDVAVCNGLCGLGCKGAKDRVPDGKAKDRVQDPKAKQKGGKGRLHVLKVIGNALPAIYPGRTALHMAAANGNVEIVRAICAVPDIDLNKKDVFGYTALHLACYSTHPKRREVLKLLLDSPSIDANVAARAKGYYFTPLHLAVKAKSTGIVDMLLDWCPIGKNYRKVLDVDTKSNSGWTALHLAVRLKILEKDDEKKTEFVTMIVAIIRFINSNIPESINKSDNTKSTPLHTSVAAGDLELVEILLEDGDKIDPELLDNQRRTALEIAVHQNDFPMVQKIQHYLERAGIVGNHQAFADSASAILVGAALLVTVTFAAWPQIPTNDSTLFWVFMSLSFYFAVAAFISAAGAAIPSKGSTLGQIRRAVLVSAFCLAFSLACAVAAFAVAGFLLVPAGTEPHRKVIATTVIGGFVCLFCLLSFVRKILKALGLYFLMLDLIAQKKLADFISTGVRTILGTSRVDALEHQYKALYSAPVNKFFKIEQEDYAASSHGASVSNSSRSHGGSVSNSSRDNENSGGETGDSSV